MKERVQEGKSPVCSLREEGRGEEDRKKRGRKGQGEEEGVEDMTSEGGTAETTRSTNGGRCELCILLS